MIKINDPTGANFLEEAIKNGSEHKQIHICAAQEIAHDGAPIVLVSYKTFEAIQRSLADKIKYNVEPEND